LPYSIQLLCVGICFYSFLLFEPYGAFHERLKRITVLLAIAVLPGTLFRSHLGFAAKKEHPILRWALALATVLALAWVLWGTTIITPVWIAITKGTAYWVLIGALLLYVFQSIVLRHQPLFSGQVQGLYVARTATVTTLVLVSTLAFAYRLFPLIPADKGGGNFFYRRDAKVCVALTDLTKTGTSTSILPEALVDKGATSGCSVAVKVIEATDSTLYVARSDDRGGALANDPRTAPEIWTDGEFVPTIYAIAKTRLAFVEYNLKKATYVSPATVSGPAPSSPPPGQALPTGTARPPNNAGVRMPHAPARR
jgi:hypothetical protein